MPWVWAKRSDTQAPSKFSPYLCCALPLLHATAQPSPHSCYAHTREVLVDTRARVLSPWAQLQANKAPQEGGPVDSNSLETALEKSLG